MLYHNIITPTLQLHLARRLETSYRDIFTDCGETIILTSDQLGYWGTSAKGPLISRLLLKGLVHYFGHHTAFNGLDLIDSDSQWTPIISMNLRGTKTLNGSFPKQIDKYYPMSCQPLSIWRLERVMRSNWDRETHQSELVPHPDNSLPAILSAYLQLKIYPRKIDVSGECFTDYK